MPKCCTQLSGNTDQSSNERWEEATVTVACGPATPSVPEPDRLPPRPLSHVEAAATRPAGVLHREAIRLEFFDTSPSVGATWAAETLRVKRCPIARLTEWRDRALRRGKRDERRLTSIWSTCHIAARRLH